MAHAAAKAFRRGFTLIELLVVIAITGVLSTVILASLNSARLKGRDARRLADIRQFRVALELFNDECGEYPPDLATGSTLGSCPPGISLGTFMSSIPTDPLGSPYMYFASGTSYVVAAYLDVPGQSGPLARDYDEDMLIQVDDGFISCADDAGLAAERLFCAIN